MEYASTTRKIHTTYANAKFWFVSWKKDRCVEIFEKIKEAIKVLKELLASLLAATLDNSEIIEANHIRAEIAEMELLIA